MTLFGRLISLSWLILAAYWLIAGAASLRGTGTRWIWWREITLRLACFALVVLILQGESATYLLNTTTPLGVLGFVLTAMGVGLAIGTRARLGSGWSTHTPRELITSGPYAYARHPLYGGLLLAIVGSAIGQSLLWLLPLLVYAPGFIRSARQEEAALNEQFADRYSRYKSRTKMFVPFVL